MFDSHTYSTRRVKGLSKLPGVGAIDVRSSHTLAVPLATVGGSFRPRWDLEFESGFQEAVGHNAATLENQLCLGTHEEGADLEHPGGGGQSDRHSPCPSDCPHKLGLRQRVRGSCVDRAGQLLML